MKDDTFSCWSPKVFEEPTSPLDSPRRRSWAVSRTEARMASVTSACRQPGLLIESTRPQDLLPLIRINFAYQSRILCTEIFMVVPPHCCPVSFLNLRLLFLQAGFPRVTRRAQQNVRSRFHRRGSCSLSDPYRVNGNIMEPFGRTA